MNQLNNTILYLAKDKSKQFIHILKNLCPKIGIPLDPNLAEWEDKKAILCVKDNRLRWWSVHLDGTDEKNIEHIWLGNNEKVVPIYTYKDLFRIIGQLTDFIPDNPFLNEEVKDKNVEFVKEIAAKAALDFKENIKENVVAPEVKNPYLQKPHIINWGEKPLKQNKINRGPDGKFAPKLPKIAKFQYESKNGDEPPSFRRVKVIEIDKFYIRGYDLEVNVNPYKIFRKDRIIDNHIEWEKI